MLSLSKKKKYILDIKKIINKSICIIILNYNKLLVNDLNKFRKRLKKNNCFIFFIKNSLFKYCILNNNLNFLKKYLIGSLFIIYTYIDYGILSKILYFNLNKYKNKIFIKAVCINNKLISLNIYKKLSFLYNKKKSLEYFFYYLKNISIIRFLKILLVIKNIKSI